MIKELRVKKEFVEWYPRFLDFQLLKWKDKDGRGEVFAWLYKAFLKHKLRL